MNTAAVKAWEQKQSSAFEGNLDRPKRQRRRRKRPGANRDCTTDDIAVDTQRPPHQQISETPSCERDCSDSPNHNRDTSRVLKQASTFNPPSIIVRVSQHSSLDRDLYVAYQSSLSTQSNLSSLIPRQNSRDRESIPESNGIIPDSQSLPGSSSYQPSSSTSLVVLGADQAPLAHQTSFLHNSTDLESPSGEIARSNDSIEDSSAFVVAASQASIIESERSKSEPAPDTTESSSGSPFGARFPSLPRSTSDPTSTFHDQHRRRAIVSEHPRKHHIIYDQVIRSTADFQSPHQRGVGQTQQRQTSSEIQVPGSADRSSHQSHNSSAHSLVFQTQVPLAFASQGSRVSNTSAGMSSSHVVLSKQFRVSKMVH